MKNFSSTLITAIAPMLIGSIAEAQSAPALRSFQIVCARSQSSQTWETISESQFATRSAVHGGTWFEIQAYANGYDTGARATFSGVSARVVSRLPRVVNRVVVGWTYTFRVDLSRSVSSGRWNISSSSLVFPYGTHSDWLNIL